MRICSLLPGATEIAYALGLGDQIVGVTYECDYPAEARNKRLVVRSSLDPETMTSSEIDARVRQTQRSGGSLYSLDVEAFKDASPDIVLTQDLCDVCAINQSEVVNACQSLPEQPAIVGLTPNRLTDVLADIARVGAATGTEARARALVQNLRERIERVSELASRSNSRPRVACLEWLDPIYYAGHWIPEMVELAGGQNGFGQTGRPSATLDWRSVLEFSPEIILAMPCGFDPERTISEFHLLQTRHGWSELPAVKTNRVFAVDGHAYFSRPGPRLVDGLELLVQLIHPDTFSLPASIQAARRLE
ncbi:MAG: cobalamin-binding protein [Candidatus Binatia bacterium]